MSNHDCKQEETIGVLKTKAQNNADDIEILFNRKPSNGYVKWPGIISILAVLSLAFAATLWAMEQSKIRDKEAMYQKLIEINTTLTRLDAKVGYLIPEQRRP